METNNPKKNKRKFKQTKQLIKLALNDGWTQPKIAEVCRTQQSIVSAWANGKKQGTEQQLKPLLKIFGHKLRRNSFRVYWCIDSETQKKTFHKVEGTVILDQVFYDVRRVAYRLVKKIPKQKLVVHHQGENTFRIIYQKRITFRHSSEELESMVEDAIWNSTISKQHDLPELLNIIDKYAENILTLFPSDANTLPFIARQALLNHGFDIDGVVEYPAIW